MTHVSATAAESANRVWVECVGENKAPAITAHSTIQLLDALRAGLGRWIGVTGYDTLLDRAVGISREDYPWISTVFQPDVESENLLAAIESFGTPVVAAGLRRLVAVLIELLGRIVGIDMAVHLITHIGVPGSRPVASTATEVKLDE